MPTINPFARPVYLMAKPAGSLCNLRCKYCYYLEKGKLYDNNEKHIMSDPLLEKFIKDYNNWRINFRIFLLFSCSCNLFIKLSILPQIEFCRLNYVVKPQNRYRTNECGNSIYKQTQKKRPSIIMYICYPTYKTNS